MIPTTKADKLFAIRSGNTNIIFVARRPQELHEEIEKTFLKKLKEPKHLINKTKLNPSQHIEVKKLPLHDFIQLCNSLLNYILDNTDVKELSWLVHTDSHKQGVFFRTENLTTIWKYTKTMTLDAYNEFIKNDLESWIKEVSQFSSLINPKHVLLVALFGEMPDHINPQSRSSSRSSSSRSPPSPRNPSPRSPSTRIQKLKLQKVEKRKARLAPLEASRKRRHSQSGSRSPTRRRRSSDQRSL
jgi:hypothetical protein